MGPDGRPAGIVGISRDITDFKRAEAALRAFESRYRLLFEGNIAGILLATLDGRVVDCNAAAANILGYESPQEALGVNTGKAHWHPGTRDAVVTFLRDRKALTGVEQRIHRKDGRPVWLMINLSRPRPTTTPGDLCSEHDL